MPGWTKATVSCGLVSASEPVPEIEMNMLIEVGIRVELTPSWLALARTLTRRMMRLPAVPGGSIGTPSQVMLFG